MEIGRIIGQRLAKSLDKAGISHAELAAAAGVSQTVVSALLRGATKDPPIGTVLRVSLALGIALESLIAGEVVELTASTFVRREEFVHMAREIAWLKTELAAVNERLATVASHMIAVDSAAPSREGAPQRVRTGRRPS